MEKEKKSNEFTYDQDGLDETVKQIADSYMSGDTVHLQEELERNQKKS
ncbi:hypothetical protein [Peribacillus tepidiphilus]